MALEPSPHLILIDDDDLSREVITLVLSDDGFRIEPFGSGESALDHLHSHPASHLDAVLCDLQMPGLSGPALAAALRPHLSLGTPVLVMSGSIPARSAIASFDAFLPKPFTAAQLRALLASPATHSIDLQAAAESEPSPHTPVLDEHILTDLSALMKPAQLRDLFALSLSEITRHTAAMHDALARKDLITFRAAAHALKGGVALIGARELQTLATHLEAVSESANQVASLDEIPAAANRLRRILGARGIELPSGPVAQGDAIA